MTTNPTAPAVQARIMRTYEVTLSNDTGVLAVETVNLSYELNDELDAVDRHGTIVEAVSQAASIEVMKRLRKLAERCQTDVSTEQVDSAKPDIRMARSRFVHVPLDESGQPIPRQS